jgi:glyoxylase-like metal-dependent hydrolase (beta-lactamase superfamily II)
MGAPEAEKIDIAMVVWLIRGGGKTILFDSGFHREKWMKQFTIADYVRPDEGDNCYLYRNLEAHAASATFTAQDRDANLRAQERMVTLAGSRERVVPGHDPRQFERYPTAGRVARIR